MTEISEKSITERMVADALKGSWVHRFLPARFWPYAQLARWERPIGWRLLMWPCWWSIALAYGFAGDGAAPISLGALAVGREAGVAAMLVLFLIGAMVMRGAGCTFNDLVDQDIDDKVARTRSRPLPSGRVGYKGALLFLALQLAVGLGILLTFNPVAIGLGFASIALIIIYPFMKRVTWWPQLFLGFAFSWGALLGWAAIAGSISWPPVLLYIGSILWVIGYDTIYAHQDKEDDTLIGVKSTALLFGSQTKEALAALYGGAFALFAASLIAASMNVVGYLALALVGVHMGWQIRNLQIDDPDRCLAHFKANSHLGWIFFIGLMAASIWQTVR